MSKSVQTHIPEMRKQAHFIVVDSSEGDALARAMATAGERSKAVKQSLDYPSMESLKGFRETAQQIGLDNPQTFRRDVNGGIIRDDLGKPIRTTAEQRDGILGANYSGVQFLNIDGTVAKSAGFPSQSPKRPVKKVGAVSKRRKKDDDEDESPTDDMMHYVTVPGTVRHGKFGQPVVVKPYVRVRRAVKPRMRRGNPTVHRGAPAVKRHTSAPAHIPVRSLSAATVHEKGGFFVDLTKGCAARPAKEWMRSMVKKLSAENPGYPEEQVKATAVKIWRDNMSEADRKAVKKREKGLVKGINAVDPLTGTVFIVKSIKDIR